jgi:tetratricopeptide (TPR) repeat protein
MSFLRRLGPVEKLEEKDCLLALEQCLRHAGDHDGVLACLRRLRELDPADPAIEPRILDILLKLGRHKEALALLEAQGQAGKGANLALRQHLNFVLGNYAQALALTRRISEKEKPPYAQSLRLYEELRQALPENIEILIQMGELLFKCEEVERHAHAAQLFEEALKLDPARSHLHRRLAHVFYERRDTAHALHHLEALFDAYDTDPETYRLYARLAHDEEDWTLPIKISSIR